MTEITIELTGLTFSKSCSISINTHMSMSLKISSSYIPAPIPVMIPTSRSGDWFGIELIPLARNPELERAEHAVACREDVKEAFSVVVAGERFMARHSTIRGNAQTTHSRVMGIKSLK